MTTNTNLERRKRSLEVLIKEAVIAVVAEQQELADQAAAAPPPPAPVPATPTPSADPAAAPAAPAEPATVDTFIDKLNVIRGGSSFSDPEVYGQLTTFWNGLPEEQKATMDTALGSVGKIVAAANQQPAAPDAGPAAPTAPSPAPATPPAPATAPPAGNAPISPKF